MTDEIPHPDASRASMLVQSSKVKRLRKAAKKAGFHIHIGALGADPEEFEPAKDGETWITVCTGKDPE